MHLTKSQTTSSTGNTRSTCPPPPLPRIHLQSWRKGGELMTRFHCWHALHISPSHPKPCQYISTTIRGTSSPNIGENFYQHNHQWWWSLWEACGWRPLDTRVRHRRPPWWHILQTPQLDDHHDQWATFLPGEQGLHSILNPAVFWHHTNITFL